MSLRLAIVIASATVLLGGCAGGDIGGFDDLSQLSNVLPVDVIYDKPASGAEAPQPEKAAAWGDTTVTTSKAAEGGPTTANSPIKVADWGQTSVHHGGGMVRR
ncbi:MAG TPA: hypothetical protein VIG38_16650 [Hyphomicrobium sp.]|jgi:hypothetical protein